jgi:peptidoglycan/LPS O-acetylase OafA/YrhL
MKINATQSINFYEIFFHYVVAIWGSLIVIIFYFLEGLIKNLKIIELNLFLGKISYSIYLFHLPIIYLISIFEWPLVLAILIYIFLQFSFSSLIYIYFEEPILKSRPNYR